MFVFSAQQNYISFISQSLLGGAWAWLVWPDQKPQETKNVPCNGYWQIDPGVRTYSPTSIFSDANWWSFMAMVIIITLRVWRIWCLQSCYHQPFPGRLAENLRHIKSHSWLYTWSENLTHQYSRRGLWHAFLLCLVWIWCHLIKVGSQNTGLPDCLLILIYFPWPVKYKAVFSFKLFIERLSLAQLMWFSKLFC